MTNEIAVWINEFVEIQQTDIGQQIKCLQKQVEDLIQEQENDKSQQLRESLSKKLLYYHAQLDLLKVMIETARHRQGDKNG